MPIDMIQFVWSTERIKNMEAGNSVQQTLPVLRLKASVG